MAQPDSLHTRLRDEIERRLEVARAATPGPWRWGPIDMTKSGKMALYCALQKPFTPGMWPGAVVLKAAEADVYPSTADAEHIALHDPADAIRRYEGELELLERHAPRLDAEDAECCRCWNDWPRIELIGLAQRLGLNAADQAGGLSGQFAAL